MRPETETLIASKGTWPRSIGIIRLHETPHLHLHERSRKQFFFFQSELLFWSFIMFHLKLKIGAYYGQILVGLRQTIEAKRRRKLRRIIILLYDYALAEISNPADAIIRDRRFEVINNPYESSGPSPVMFYLLRHFKKYLRGHRFHDDDERKKNFEHYFQERNKTFSSGIGELPRRCTNPLMNCTDVREIRVTT